MNFKSENGFSMPEILLGLGFMGLIGIVLFNSYFSSYLSWDINQDKITFQQVQREIVTKMSTYIRQSSSIDLTPNQDQIKVMFDNISSESDPAYDFDGLGYGLSSDNKLYYRKHHPGEGWGNSIMMTSLTVSNLIFSYQNGILTMELTILSDDENEAYSFAENFNPRLAEVNIP